MGLHKNRSTATQAHEKQTVSKETGDTKPTRTRNSKHTEPPKAPSTNYAHTGQLVHEFESVLSTRFQTNRLLSTVTAYAGAEILFKALDLRLTSTAHVLCSPLSPPFVINAIIDAGAEPVFIDVDPQTGNLNAGNLREYIKKHYYQKVGGQTIHVLSGKLLKAILISHYCGLPADTQPFFELQKEFNCTLIEDASSAFGSSTQGRPIGTHGLPTLFAFNNTQLPSTGGKGGLILLPNESTFQRAKSLIEGGLNTKTGLYDQRGFDFRMLDLQARIGLETLELVEDEIKRRNTLCQQYDSIFTALMQLRVPKRNEQQMLWNAESYWLKILSRANVGREEFVQALHSENFKITTPLKPLHLQPAWQTTARLPGAEQFYQTALFMPVHNGITSSDLKHVFQQVKQMFDINTLTKGSI